MTSSGIVAGPDIAAGPDIVAVRRVRRARRRAETICEIVAAAEGEVVRHGAQGVALRAVARAWG